MPYMRASARCCLALMLASLLVATQVRRARAGWSGCPCHFAASATRHPLTHAPAAPRPPLQARQALALAPAPAAGDEAAPAPEPAGSGMPLGKLAADCDPAEFMNKPCSPDMSDACCPPLKCSPAVNRMAPDLYACQ